MSSSISEEANLVKYMRRELKHGYDSSWESSKDTTGNKAHKRAFTDNVFDNDATTQNVYEEFAKPIIKSAMDGINSTIFAYGQTSSGKTHTMRGDSNEAGIIPLAVRSIFNTIEQTPEREYLLRVSYLEIYNEVITDLLNPKNKDLRIRENIYVCAVLDIFAAPIELERGVYVEGLSEEAVSCPEEVLQIMDVGETNRHIGETNMNERSSRSHTIFRVVIESRDRAEVNENDEDGGNMSFSDSGAVKISCLTLVDLAGSERISQTKAEGQRLKEGAHINKSLLALGSVISKLSSDPEGHIPYRDSKLTRILQPSLGGNAKTGIICTITPAGVHCEETISTLKFASRAKCIQNKPSINEILSREVQIKRYKQQIDELERRLSELSQREQAEKLERLKHLIISSEQAPETMQTKRSRNDRLTWAPGLDDCGVTYNKFVAMEGAMGTSRASAGDLSDEHHLVTPKLSDARIIVESDMEDSGALKDALERSQDENKKLKDQLERMSFELSSAREALEFRFTATDFGAMDDDGFPADPEIGGRGRKRARTQSLGDPIEMSMEDVTGSRGSSVTCNAPIVDKVPLITNEQQHMPPVSVGDVSGSNDVIDRDMEVQTDASEVAQERELIDLRQQLDDARRRAEDVLNKLSMLQGAHTTLELQAREMESALREAAAAAEAGDGQKVKCQQLASDLFAHKELHLETARQLEAAEGRLGDLEFKHAQQETRLKEAEEARDRLLATLENNEAQLSSAKRHASNWKERAQVLEGKLQTAEEGHKSMCEESASLRRQLDESTKAMSTQCELLKQERQAQEETIRRLEADLQAAVDEKEAVAEQALVHFRSLEERNNETKMALDQAQSELSTVEAEVLRLRAENQVMSDEIAETRASLAQETASAHAAGQAAEGLRNHVIALETQLNDEFALTQALAVKDALVQKLSAEVEAVTIEAREEVERARAEAKAEMSAASELLLKHEKAAERHAARERELYELSADLNEKRAELASKCKVIENLELALKAVENEREAMQKDAGVVAATSEELRQRLAEAEATIAQQSQQRSSLEETVRRKQANFQNLVEQNHEDSARVESLEAEVSNMKQEIADYKEAIAQLKCELAAARSVPAQPQTVSLGNESPPRNQILEANEKLKLRCEVLESEAAELQRRLEMTTKASALDAERQSQHLAMLEGRLSELQAENQSLREQSDAAADNTHMEGNAAGPTSGGSALGLIHTGSGALGILGESSNRSNAAPSAAKSTRLDALLELGRKRAIQNASAGERSPGEENQKPGPLPSLASLGAAGAMTKNMSGAHRNVPKSDLLLGNVRKRK